MGRDFPSEFEQMVLLNTNTRYLHDSVISYAERLLTKLPDSFEVVYLVNSGSEANELALRMARAATGRRAMAVLDHGYHGNTSAMIDLSPYKFNGPGGSGRPDWVTVLPLADPYRAEGGGAVEYRKTVEDLLDDGDRVAGLLAELPEPRPDLEERLDALRRELHEQSQAHERLRVLERDLDVGISARQRMVLILCAGVVSMGAAGLFVVGRLAGASDPTGRIACRGQRSGLSLGAQVFC